MNDTTQARSSRRGTRPGELFALELPVGRADGVAATSPAAWLHALDRAGHPSAEARRLAEHYAARAVRRGRRWVVMVGDHRTRRAFRRLHSVDLTELACAETGAVITHSEGDALVAAGLSPAELQPLVDPSADCSALGVVRLCEALERLAELGFACVRFHRGPGRPPTLMPLVPAQAAPFTVARVREALTRLEASSESDAADIAGAGFMVTGIISIPNQIAP